MSYIPTVQNKKDRISVTEAEKQRVTDSNKRSGK